MRTMIVFTVFILLAAMFLQDVDAENGCPNHYACRHYCRYTVGCRDGHCDNNLSCLCNYCWAKARRSIQE
uniref:Defensin n=1 Tax=Ruditapes philippinarum TaxID=129788 RepID=J7FWK2_RUDPH|nr:defensin [Ruditapes philippinarum]AFP49981.1 defensin [Ruditapes philippinarum]AFP49999.1 defensin [Ruditapes philippinarum]AFP50007.1 defensin [Ruditapes philippinarum]AFP50009.1 defensin [Ruditapes philippinarum]